MKTLFRFPIAVVVLALITMTNVYAVQPEGSLYLEGKTHAAGLVLLHGRGKHPDWKVVAPLRNEVNRKLGLHTLSLRMPNANTQTPFREYASLFPDAFKRITQGIRFLRARGVETIYLFGHSMGARMASGFLAEQGSEELEGLIIAGGRNNGGSPFSCYENLKEVEISVLDIWGNDNRKDVRAAAARSEFVSSRYKQVPVLGANHKFEGREDQLVSIVIEWLLQKPK